MLSRTRLAIGGAVGAALTSVIIFANGGVSPAHTMAIPGLSTEAHAAGSRLSARDAEALARVAAQEQIDRVTAAGSNGSGRGAGEPIATIRGRPATAGEMTLVETKFVPASEHGQPVAITSAITGSSTSGDLRGGATWLFVFRSTQVDRPKSGVRVEDWADGAIEVEVVLSDTTGKALSETLWIIASLEAARP